MIVIQDMESKVILNNTTQMTTTDFLMTKNKYIKGELES